MKRDNNVEQRNNSKLFWVLTALSLASVVMIGLLAYFMHSTLYHNLLNSRKDYLNKKVEIESNEIQREFAGLRNDLNYYAHSFAASDKDTVDHQQVQRFLNNYTSVIDTVFILKGGLRHVFTLDGYGSLVRDEIPGLRMPMIKETEGLTVEADSGDLIMSVKINLKNFFSKNTTDYLFENSENKFVYEEGTFTNITPNSSQKTITFQASLVELLNREIRKGSRGDYESGVLVGLNNNEVSTDALIVQYPFKLRPLPQDFAVVFVQEKVSLISDINSSYLYWLAALLSLLVFILYLMLKFFKSTFRNKLLLEKKSQDINLLFNQQTMLLQQSNGFVYYHDKFGKVYKASENVKDVLGHTPEEFSLNVKRLIPQEDLDRIQPIVREALENKREYVYYEIGIARSDGKVIRTKNFEKLFYDEEGDFSGSIGICTDIHEKYLADQELIKSENRLRAVLNSLPDVIYIYNNEGIFLDYYVQDSGLLQAPENDLIGKNISEVFSFPVNRLILDTFSKSVKSGKIQTQEIDVIINGGKRFFEMRFFKLDDRRVISLARDITDQKLWENGLREAKEAAESASKHKSEFLANMSHEIRTPMNGLLGMISLLATTELSPKQKQYISIIEDSGESLLSIVNDILDYSKIEAGKLELRLTAFDLRNEIKRVVDIFSGMVLDKNIHTHLNISDKIPELVLLDRKKLKQILFNIIGNAVKFTPEGGTIEINISGEVIISHHLMLSFSVKDSGLGIPSSHINELTQPFIQVDSSDTREHTGTGLGLSIASKLIELMGGELQIDSEEGKGSEFSFTIMAPVPELGFANEPNTGEVRLPETVDGQNFSKKFPARILLVEDNEINQRFMTIVLAQMGYVIDIANNGLEAIGMVKRNEYDLIFMDHQMPKMNGAEATKEIRKLRGNQTLNIVGLSANVLDEGTAHQEGMDAYLSKPVTIEEISETIKNCFEALKQ